MGCACEWEPGAGSEGLRAQEGECQIGTGAEPREESQGGDIRGPRGFGGRGAHEVRVGAGEESGARRSPDP